MKKLLYSAVILLALATGCKKQMESPERTLIGTWVSNSPILQFPIQNVEGVGSSISFLQYKENGVSRLKVTYPEGISDYEILHIGKAELYLIDDKGQQIAFYRAGN